MYQLQPKSATKGEPLFSLTTEFCLSVLTSGRWHHVLQMANREADKVLLGKRPC